MNLFKLTCKVKLNLLLLCLTTLLGYSQRDTERWKAQLALGVSSPSQSGFVEDFEGKSVNFPTINIGIQHMFKRQLGAKLDYGFNRISNEDHSPEFKLNYTRINLQAIYDPTKNLTFLPQRMGVVAHAGPGYTFIKPLGDFTQNDTSFFNAIAGIEWHFAVSKRLSLYLDTSYIFGFAKDFDPITEGYGSFNGNLLTITAGITFSLSGCQYCD